MANLPSRVPNVLGDTALDRFDVVVIGSGAGGSAATRLLAEGGLNVCVLEAGDNAFRGIDDPGATPEPIFSSDELKLSVRSFSSSRRGWIRAPDVRVGRPVIHRRGERPPKTVGGGWVRG